MTHKIQALGLALLLLGLISFGAGCQAFSEYEYKGNLLNPPKPIGDFELQNAAGESFHLSDLEGDIALVYFGYTFCPDVCPLTMWDMKQALAEVQTKDRVQVVFISVDPDRDTPAVVSEYISGYGPEFIGLTDDFERIKEVMKPFGAYAEKAKANDSAAEYLVNHTARVYLLDPNQELLLTYPFGFEPEDLASDLNHLLEQDANS